MKKEYNRAEIAVCRRIEKVMSDILSDKYDCKIKIRWLPEEYGYPVIEEDEEIHCRIIGENKHEYVIVKKPKNGDGQYEAAHGKKRR